MNKKLYVILLFTFLEIFAYAMLLPLIPFQVQKLGGNPYMVGLIFATYSVFQFIASPFLGKFSDRYGRKRILLISQIGTLLGFFIIGYFPFLLFIFMSRVIDGISGGNQLVAYAAVSDITSEKQRSQAFGYMSGLLGIGLLTGPAVGAYLYHFGFSFVAYIAAFVSFITILVMLVFLPETRSKSSFIVDTKMHGLREYFENKKLLSTLILIIAITLVANVLIFGFTLFSQKQLHFSPESAGYTLAYMGIIGIITQLLVFTQMNKLFNEEVILKIGIISTILGFCILAISLNIFVLLFSLLLVVLGIVLATPILSGKLTKLFPGSKHGQILGVNQSVNSICQILGPIVAGTIVANFGGWVFGITSALIMLVGISAAFYTSHT